MKTVLVLLGVLTLAMVACGLTATPIVKTTETPIPTDIPPTPTMTSSEAFGSAINIPYDDLYRLGNFPDYVNKRIWYVGKVAQVERTSLEAVAEQVAEQIEFNSLSAKKSVSEKEGEKLAFFKVGQTLRRIEGLQILGEIIFRIYLTPESYGDWTDDVLVTGYPEHGPVIREGDVVQFVGVYHGLKNRKTVLGTQRTLPMIRLGYMRLATNPPPTAQATPTLGPTPTPTRTPTLCSTEMWSASPTPTPWPSGLVGWWPGDGNANDAAGRNHGTLTGGATFSTGKVGQGFSLDGINDLVNLGNAPNLRISEGDYTVAVWVCFNALQGDMSIVDKMSPSGLNTDGWRLLKQADNHFWFCLGGLNTNGCEPGGSTTVRSNTVARVGVWFHVTAAKRSNTISIYVNGALEEAKPLASFTDTQSTNLLIGSNAFQGAHLNGLVDNVGIWNRALSDTEINATYLRDEGT